MKRTVLFVVILLVAGGSCVQSARPRDFGKEWIRSHPLASMGLVLLEESLEGDKPFDLELYKHQNYSFLLAWRPREGLYGEAARTGYPWFVNLTSHGGMSDKLMEQVSCSINKYPGCVGVYINDEPTLHGRYREGKPANSFATTGELIDWAHQQWPEKLVLSNIGGAGGSTKHYYGTLKEPTPQQQEEMKHYGFGDYVSDYMRLVRPDVLMFDAYIFKYGEGNESGVTPYWYQSLWVIRKAGLEAGVPYWAWMGSWDRPAKRGYNVRLPSESDYRMNVFSVLTYGFTGIADFTYCGLHDRNILLRDGTPSPLFEHSAQVHKEAAHLGQSLRYLTSTHIACISSSEKTRVPTYLEEWTPGVGGDERITSLEIVEPGEHVRGKKGLLGYFQDDDGDTYFMLTNLFQRAETSAEDCQLTFRITFDRSIREVFRLSRTTGLVERLEVDDPAAGMLITLPGGTGDLFKYDNGNFAGLDI